MNIEFMYRLRKAMNDKGITASELSRISGVGKSDISYYLKGKYLPKQDKCYLLAKALDVDPGWLMTGIRLPGFFYPSLSRTKTPKRGQNGQLRGAKRGADFFVL